MLFLRTWNTKLFILLYSLLFTATAFGKEPAPHLKFIQNKNQWPASVHFSARIPGGNMMIGPGKFAYCFLDGKRLDELHAQSHEAEADAAMDWNIKGQVVFVNFIGADLSGVPMPFGRYPDYYNYYLGDDPHHWASKVFAWSGMLYPSLYKNIDLKIYSEGINLKYDFIVAPDGDPSQIKLQYEGADELLLEKGDLSVKTSLAVMIEKKTACISVHQW